MRATCWLQTFKLCSQFECELLAHESHRDHTRTFWKIECFVVFVFVGARLLCLQILPPYALQLFVSSLKIRAKHLLMHKRQFAHKNKIKILSG